MIELYMLGAVHCEFGVDPKICLHTCIDIVIHDNAIRVAVEVARCSERRNQNGIG